MKSVAIITSDEYLFQKMRLELLENGNFFVHQNGEDCDVCFVDVDTADIDTADAIRLSRRALPGAVTLPLPIGAAARLAERGGTGALLSLVSSERLAILHKESVQLTELEFALVSELYSYGGEYCPREELLRRVWGENADSGILNVYIHYLRTKLERHGEKIILSSRKSGYAIDRKYLEVLNA